MRRTHYAVLAGLLAFLPAAPAAAQQGGKKSEPPSMTTLVGGKSLDEWVKEIPSRDPSKAENAIRTVMLYGPELAGQAVPTIIKVMKRHESVEVDTSVRVNGAIALGFLLGHAKNPDQAQVKEAIDLLTRMLKESQAIVRYRSAQALSQFGPEARSAIPNLLALLHDPHTFETRHAAALALGKVAKGLEGQQHVTVLQALYDASKSEGTRSEKSFYVRLGAIQALTLLGPPVSPSLRTNFMNALDYVSRHDPEKGVQIWGHMAYMVAKGDVDHARVEAIGKLLETGDLQTRIQAAQALGAVASAKALTPRDTSAKHEAKLQLPRLITALDDSDRVVVFWTAWALRQLGPEAMKAVPKLQSLQQNTEYIGELRTYLRETVDIINGKKSNGSSGEKE
jgi:hypothetical protein